MTSDLVVTAFPLARGNHLAPTGTETCETKIATRDHRLEQVTAWTQVT